LFVRLRDQQWIIRVSFVQLIEYSYVILFCPHIAAEEMRPSCIISQRKHILWVRVGYYRFVLA